MNASILMLQQPGYKRSGRKRSGTYQACAEFAGAISFQEKKKNDIARITG